jgi:tyrosyl-tRNA synthetase
MPQVALTADEAREGVSATTLVVRAELASSNRQARTQLQGGQYKLDGEAIDPKFAFEKMPPAWFDKPRVLQLGKKKVLVQRP